MTKRIRLKVQNFAQITEADLTFGDLTVLVGAQGTGKSLSLQWLKAALDGKHIIGALRDAGQTPSDVPTTIDLIFGAGMRAAWDDASKITFNGRNVNPVTLGRRGKSDESAFFIPAHRSMLISDGWASPFQKLTTSTPVVARMFSQNLFDLFTSRGNELFPLERVLKQVYRDEIDDAVFHGGKVALEQDRQLAKRLKLTHGNSSLPFMTWTAGQREFTPLLLGFYHLLPGSKKPKQPGIDWVIIEEPEMGLHPRAITVVLLLVLELLWRGYRVVMTTHSPHVLTAIWMLRRLAEHQARWQLVCEAFGTTASQQMRSVAEAALAKDYAVHALAFGEDGRVRSKDISSLDPDDEDDDISGWGGLTAFSSQFGSVVRKAVNESER